jgi:hypothetical protein
MSENEFTISASLVRRYEPVLGKRSYRYPKQMTLSVEASNNLAERADERTPLRIIEGADGEPFYFSARCERLKDGALRIYDITPSPTFEQREVEFEQTV